MRKGSRSTRALRNSHRGTDLVAPGVVLLDKAVGDSSFAALAAVKRAFGTGKVGHTGTLDPFADGLLVTLVAQATRCARYLTGLDKTYVAEVRFGEETDSCDRTGEVVTTAPVPDGDRVLAVLPAFTGEISQVPPAYSAIHVNGRRAYELARSGEEVRLSARTVVVHELTCISIGHASAVLRVRCSAGTYVRSLARDIGRAAGSAAHLTGLRRTAVGPFLADEAWSAGDLQAAALIPLADALQRVGVRRIDVDGEVAARMRNGARVLAEGCGGGTAGTVVACHGDSAVATGQWRDDVFVYHVVFPLPGDDHG